MSSNTPSNDERRPLLEPRRQDSIHQTSSSSSRQITFPSRSRTLPASPGSESKTLQSDSQNHIRSADRPIRPSRKISFPPSHDPYPTSNPIPSPSDFSSSGLSSIDSESESDSDWDDGDGDSVRRGKSDVNKHSVLYRSLHKQQHHHHHRHHHHHGSRHHRHDQDDQQEQEQQPSSRSQSRLQRSKQGQYHEQDDTAEYGVRHRAQVNGDIPSHWVRHDGLPKFSRDCLWR